PLFPGTSGGSQPSGLAEPLDAGQHFPAARFFEEWIRRRSGAQLLDDLVRMAFQAEHSGLTAWAAFDMLGDSVERFLGQRAQDVAGQLLAIGTSGYDHGWFLRWMHSHHLPLLNTLQERHSRSATISREEQMYRSFSQRRKERKEGQKGLERDVGRVLALR